MPRFGGAPKCPRCNKSVYQAEEVKAAGKSWHKSCFICKGCRKGLASNNFCDAEGEVWCSACYGKNFGPKGYGYGGGAGILQMTDKVTPAPKPKLPSSSPKPIPPAEAKSGNNYCPKCEKSVPGKFCPECGEKAVSKPKSKPKSASGCPKCGKSFKVGTKFCTECGTNLAPGKMPVSQFGKLSVGSRFKESKKKKKFGGGDRCKRCGKIVYPAEKQMGAGSVWHKACFRCASCGKGLSSNNTAEKEGEIYCTTCHAKQFGPKGFGYGQGGGTLAYTE